MLTYGFTMRNIASYVDISKCWLFFHMSTCHLIMSNMVSYAAMLCHSEHYCFICQHVVNIAQDMSAYNSYCSVSFHPSISGLYCAICTELFYMSTFGSYVDIWFILHNMTPYVDIWTYNPKYGFICQYMVPIARYDTIYWHVASWFNSSWKWH